MPRARGTREPLAPDDKRALVAQRQWTCALRLPRFLFVRNLFTSTAMRLERICFLLHSACEANSLFSSLSQVAALRSDNEPKAMKVRKGFSLSPAALPFTRCPNSRWMRKPLDGISRTPVAVWCTGSESSSCNAIPFLVGRAVKHLNRVLPENPASQASLMGCSLLVVSWAFLIFVSKSCHCVHALRHTYILCFC